MELHNKISGEEQYLFIRVAFSQIMSSLTVFVLSEGIYQSDAFRWVVEGPATALLPSGKDAVSLAESITAFAEQSSTALSIDFIRDTVRRCIFRMNLTQNTPLKTYLIAPYPSLVLDYSCTHALHPPPPHTPNVPQGPMITTTVFFNSFVLYLILRINYIKTKRNVRLAILREASDWEVGWTQICICPGHPRLHSTYLHTTIKP